jgi:hypothetical protein
MCLIYIVDRVFLFFVAFCLMPFGLLVDGLFKFAGCRA